MRGTVSENDSALWVVCEDGVEYIERFRRFLSGVQLLGVASAAALWPLLQQCRPRGVLLDLDFRRTPAEMLIDDHGRQAVALGPDEQRRLAAQQGLLILRELRARGLRLPVVLFADLEDPRRADFLCDQLGPLRIAASDTGLDTLAHWLAELGSDVAPDPDTERAPGRRRRQ